MRVLAFISKYLDIRFKCKIRFAQPSASTIGEQVKDRLFTGLLAAVLVMQVWIVYRQYRPPATSPRPEAVQDVDFEIDLRDLPLLGSRSAKVALVEFSDFECPFCQRHATTVAEQIKERFVSPGHVLYAFANNPLPNHLNAKMLASSAVCVGADRFWEMHDLIFRQKLRVIEEIVSVGRDWGLNEAEFRSCIEVGDQPAVRIDEDVKLAKRLGLQGTPSFAIGVVRDSRLAVQKIIVGAQSLDVFERTVAAVLKYSGANVQVQ
jgi:protein-disulfide isomerase